jgi:hypothetical protein
MPKKDSVKPGAQHTQFAAMARELGCDESELAFNAKLEKVARAAVPRKPATRAKVTKPQKPEKPAANAEAPAKKKTRFNLSGA